MQITVGLRAGANREILDFLRTGVLEWRPLGPCTRERYVAPGGPPPTDWVGLNYYSRVVMNWRCQVAPLLYVSCALAALDRDSPVLLLFTLFCLLSECVGV